MDGNGPAPAPLEASLIRAAPVAAPTAPATTKLEPQRRFLFLDFRHTQPGDREWLGPDGQPLPVGYATGPQPAGPPVDAVPRSRFQPDGVRLVAQPARKVGPLDPREDPGSDLVVHEAGRYRTWYWRGESDIGAVGGPVILHFKLRAAELYGFEWV